MVLFGIVAGVVCGLIAFGWWTIGFPRRRLVGGAAMLLTAFLFSPLALLHSGERYGFDGVVVGLIAISLVVGGGFFFTALGSRICFEIGCQPPRQTSTVRRERCE